MYFLWYMNYIINNNVKKFGGIFFSFWEYNTTISMYNIYYYNIIIKYKNTANI